MTLYLKYRPRTLSELDLTEVRETLGKIIKSGKSPHAFLFSGPKGLGKTSAARVLAAIVNCQKLGKNGEPCNKCSSCKSIISGTNLDVIEIDAASHRGIDDVRALREAVKLAPAGSDKKVYIIDEAHMLTLEASNALLKTLEEPPEHVIFILATTNPEKLIETVKSRAVNVVFRKPTKEELVRSLTRVVKGEKISADKSVLESIADASGGSFRDAVKILETAIISGEQLKEGKFKGAIDIEVDVDGFIRLLLQKDVKGVLSKIGEMDGSGMSTEYFLQKTIERLRQELLAKVGVGEPSFESSTNEIAALIGKLTDAFSQTKTSPIEVLPLEIAVVTWCNEIQDGAHNGGQIHSERSRVKSTVEVKSEAKETLGQDVYASPPASSSVTESWVKVLSEVKPMNKSLEALLKAARPINFDGRVLTLGVFYSFHKERLESAPHRQLLDEIVRKAFGKEARVVCTLTKVNPSQANAVKDSQGVVLTEADTVAGDTLTGGREEDIIKFAKEIFGS